jgi:hypothetical protein
MTIYVTMRQAQASMNVGTLEETVPTAEIQRAISTVLTITGESIFTPNSIVGSEAPPRVKFSFKPLF